MSDRTPASPWVTVVVLAYRQAEYLPACLQSLERHGLEGIQVILADNGSDDGSSEQMRAWAETHPAELVLLKDNHGHCRAFNRALKLARGTYVLDLAADDELPEDSLRIRAAALDANPEAAFCHGNALLIDRKSKPLGYEHPPGQSDPAWSGHIWQRLFEGRFISPPTVLFRTETLRKAGGYDESLSFEDFDIWMRLARNQAVCYVPAVCSLHRLHSGSASASQVHRRNHALLESVLIICQKALQMAQTPEERQAISSFARYHLRLAAYTGKPIWVRRYADWLEESGLPHTFAWPWHIVSKLPLGSLYSIYTQWKRRWDLVSL